ncbi:hypothetical protein [Nocardioides zeae]|uniref:DUF4878 domain-containing protein n=1 Tax=Nocardioides zeae TaxID=1457234 RepID=A0A6P0HPC7_9ACTN|nr:hypothetical protein [Nocardioides zeae]NEN80170.1 hypothetical protein [Nocardioides zeae]
MDVSLPRLATLGSLTLALSAVAACGSSSDGGDGGSGGSSSDASSSASADGAAGGAATAEEAYAAWRASVLDDDLDAFDAASVDGAWSDLSDTDDDADLLASLVDAAGTGQLELPGEPEAFVGFEAILAAEPDEELSDVDREEFLTSVEDEFDLESVDDLALFVVPWDQGDGPEDVDTLFVRTDGTWLFFGMEPSD